MGSGSPEIFSEITSPPDQNGKAAPSRLVSVFGWARKGFWAVLDQGLFAGSNFLVSVLLARDVFPLRHLLTNDGMARKAVGSALSCIPSPR
jgi:hypothetical protein